MAAPPPGATGAPSSVPWVSESSRRSARPTVPDAWDQYARTEVVISRAEGDLVVRPAPPGVLGEWPWPTDDPLYLLTAWDPGPARPGIEVNRRRQEELEAVVRPMVSAAWSAVGTDPCTGHREEGIAVGGISEEVVLEIGARFGQDAVFAWSPQGWDTVSCRDGRRRRGGWSLDRAAARPLHYYV